MDNKEYLIFSNKEEMYLSEYKIGVPNELGYFYILEVDDNKVKIGSTHDIKRRYNELYKSLSEYGGKYINRIAFFYCKQQLKRELLLHQFFQRYRISNTELFNLSFDSCIDKLPYGIFRDIYIK